MLQEPKFYFKFRARIKVQLDSCLLYSKYNIVYASLSYLSIAEVIYSPDELLSINCGSSSNFSTRDGRNWTVDINFLTVESRINSVAAPALTPTTLMGPYTYARLSHSQFTYSFPVTAGPKFLRLFFYSTSYQNFDRTNAYFSVKFGPYTYTLLKLLQYSFLSDHQAARSTLIQIVGGKNTLISLLLKNY